MRSKAWWKAVAAPAALALVMTACGGASDDSADDAASAVQEGGDDGGGDDGGDDGGRSGGTFSTAWTAIPENVDPNVFGGIVTQKLGQNFMETLVVYDGSDAGDETALGVDDIEPNLAETIEANEDGTVYTMKLHEGVMSPYGNELTTADVEWSFQRAIENDFVAGILLNAANVDVENPITVIDEYTFEYNTTGPSAVATAVLHWHSTGIFDSTEAQSHATEDDPWAMEWMMSNSASFGPYNITSVDPGVEIRMTAHDDYWKGTPEYDDVILRAVPEASSRIQLLLSGEVDLILEVPFDQIATLEASDDVTVYKAPDTNRHTLILNNRDERFADPRVRTAISHAIDRDALVSAVYAGEAQPALSGLSSALIHPEPDNPVSYDPDRATELLEEAGVGDGFEFTVAINSSRPGPFAEQLARLIQTDLAAVGITMNIEAIPSLADFEAAVAERNLEAWLYTERPTLADPGYSFNLYNRTDGAVNNQGYSNPDLDEMIVEILGSPEGPERDAVVKEATELVLEETPIVYLVETPDLTASKADLCCYIGYPDGAPIVDDLVRR
jgi:peptide/nickel transport system substrate-binding protein